MFFSKIAIKFAEEGKLSDKSIRLGIRTLVLKRLILMRYMSKKSGAGYVDRFAREMSHGPIALMVARPNEQHYELPPEFFIDILGKRLKYSCCHWPAEVDTLDAAENRALELTGERARIRNGMKILDLGCGWGAFSLWAAEKYPDAEFTAVSNSNPQREFILESAKNKGISNLKVVAADMNLFVPEKKFDRIVSVEMFEHMRNWKALLEKIESWLEPEGRFFLHIFSHRTTPYFFETSADDDWMGRYFFTAGVMPSDDLLYRFQDKLEIEAHWRLDGNHYRKTAEEWLKNLDARKDSINAALKKAYGDENAATWFRRWRIFFMACAEVWGFRDGTQWLVSHYLMRKISKERG